MSVVAAGNQPVAHTGIHLPYKQPTAELIWADIERKTHGQMQVPQNVRDYYDKYASGGTHSQADRTVTISIEGSDQTIAIGAKVSTKVQEVKELVGALMKVDPAQLEIKRKLTTGGSSIQKAHEEVSSHCIVSGIRSFNRKKATYQHPILIIGGGLGGIQTMVDLQGKGRHDFVCIEKHADFGGHSWISVANKFTKLQTERGTYHVNYIKPEAPVPTHFGDMEYKTWPNRDALLLMMREGAREHGLYEKAMFHNRVERIIPKSGAYAVQYVPEQDEDGDGEILMAGAVISWPGNLTVYNTLEFPGEDEFGGYIEYSSFDKVDYPQCERKTIILYGHGAFTIENVRTLVEHRCKKVFVLCRKRNLCGMKMMSWMAGQCDIPVPGNLMLDVFQKMYDLVGFDVWTAHCVQTDVKRSFAQIGQRTVFGVTDVYFLAGYYDLMEVVVDEIKRLSHMCAHTKKNRKIDCEVVIKAIGTSPTFKTDKQLGIKEIVGVWINGDPLRPVSCNGMFVQARNFGSFSSGPGFAPAVKQMNYFIEYPEDWLLVKDQLPRNKAGERPAYVPNSSYFLPMYLVLTSNLPNLAQECNLMDSLKARKQKAAHPLPVFLEECKAEWEAYIKAFREAGMVDDRPDPPYPYTVEIMEDFIRRSDAQAYSHAAARK